MAAEAGGKEGTRVRRCEQIDAVSPDDWADLTARPPASIAGSRPWFEAARATVDREADPCLLLVEKADRLLGLLPLVREDGASAPIVRFAGAPYNDLADAMALPGHSEEVARALVEALVELAVEGCSVQLDDLDPRGALAGADPGRRLLRWGSGSIAPVIDLRDGVPSPSRKRERAWDRALRRLETAHRVEFHCHDGAAAAEVLPRFLQQRGARLRALGRDLAAPPVELVEAAVAALAPRQHCAIAEMTVDGAAVARDLYLLDGGVAMLWLRALDMGWLRDSCGHLLLRATAERLAAAGCSTLDLGRGAEPYKLAAGARERILLNATLSPILTDHSARKGLVRTKTD